MSLKVNWLKRVPNWSKIFKIWMQGLQVITSKIQCRLNSQVILYPITTVENTNWDTFHNWGTVKTPSTLHLYYQMASHGVSKFTQMVTGKMPTVITSQSSSRCTKAHLWCNQLSLRNMSIELKWYLIEVVIRKLPESISLSLRSENAGDTIDSIVLTR